MCPLQTQFPHLYSVCDPQHILLSLSSRGADAAPAVPGGPRLVPGGGFRAWWPQMLSLCGPSITYEGAGQGPGWTGTRALQAGLPACPGHLPTVILHRQPPTPICLEKLKARDPAHALGLSGGPRSALPGASSTQSLLLTFLHPPHFPPSISCRAGPSNRPTQRPAFDSGFVPYAPSSLRRSPRRPVPSIPSGRLLTHAAGPGGGCAAALAGRATWRGPPGWQRGPGPAPERGATAARGAPWRERTRRTDGQASGGGVRAPLRPPAG